MKQRNLVYYISKFTLLDELLGILYWAFAIYGIYLIVGVVSSQIILVTMLLVYIVLVTVVYIISLKKLKAFFKNDSE